MRRQGWRAATQLRLAVQRQMSTNGKKGADRVSNAPSKADLQKAHAPEHKLPSAADTAQVTKQAVKEGAAKTEQQASAGLTGKPAAVAPQQASTPSAADLSKAAAESQVSRAAQAGRSPGQSAAAPHEAQVGGAPVSPAAEAAARAAARSTSTSMAPSFSASGTAAKGASGSASSSAGNGASSASRTTSSSGGGGSGATKEALPAAENPALGSVTESNTAKVPTAAELAEAAAESPLSAGNRGTTRAAKAAAPLNVQVGGAQPSAEALKAAQDAAKSAPTSFAGVKPAAPSGPPPGVKPSAGTPLPGGSTAGPTGSSTPAGGGVGNGVPGPVGTQPPPVAGRGTAVPASGAVPPGQPTPTPPTGPPGKDPNRWLLHPALPIDVRLLAGLGAVAGAAYLYSTQQDDTQGGDGSTAASPPIHKDDFEGNDGTQSATELLVDNPDAVQPQHNTEELLHQQASTQNTAHAEDSPHSREADLWRKLNPDAADGAAPAADVNSTDAGAAAARRFEDSDEDVSRDATGAAGLQGASGTPGIQEHKPTERKESVAEKVSDTAAAAKSAAKGTADRVSKAASDSAERAKDAATDAKASVESGLKQAKHSASRTVEDVKESASAAEQSTEEAANAGFERIKRSAQAGLHRAEEKVESGAQAAKGAAKGAVDATRSALHPSPPGAASNPDSQSAANNGVTHQQRSRTDDDDKPPGSGGFQGSAPSRTGSSASASSKPAPATSEQPAAEHGSFTDDPLADAAAVAAAMSRGDTDRSAPNLRGTLGMHQDLGPAGLVRRAIDRGEGAGDDWEEYRHRLAQAASDARTFAEALQSAQQFHQAEVARLQADIGKRDQHAASLSEAAQRAAVQHQQDLRAQAAEAEEKRRADLRLQASQLAAKAVETAVRERCDRIKEIDNVRLRLGALGRAFSTRSEEARISHEAHQIALATFGLADALATGRPFAMEVEQLAAGGRDDPIVRAALTSLPPDVARQGLPTEGQLADRFQDVAASARALALLPEGRVGPLSLGLSKLAAKLKVDERSAVKAGLTADEAGVGHNAESGLAQAQAYLAAGDLTAAARALQAGVEGTAAAAAVADWVRAAQARATADQAARLLHAHATALSASLS